MRFAMIGLGRMGANMVRRLRCAGLPVAACNRKPAVTKALAMETGLVAADSMEDLIGLLESPRAIWLMLPEGGGDSVHINKLASLLDAGDLVIDGGNSFYKDSIARARVLGEKGIFFVDADFSISRGNFVGGIRRAHRPFILHRTYARRIHQWPDRIPQRPG